MAWEFLATEAVLPTFSPVILLVYLLSTPSGLYIHAKKSPANKFQSCNCQFQLVQLVFDNNSSKNDPLPWIFAHMNRQENEEYRDTKIQGKEQCWQYCFCCQKFHGENENKK